MSKAQLTVKDNTQVLSSALDIWEKGTKQWLDLITEELWADDMHLCFV